MTPHRILIIDDHPLMRGAYAHRLEHLLPGARIEQAGRLDEALALLDRIGPCPLIILDLGLPDAVGTQGLQSLRARTPNQRVLVASAQSDRELIDRCLRLGAMGFLPKTASGTHLEQAVQRILSDRIYLPPDFQDLQPSVSTAIPQAPHAPASLRALRELGLTQRQADVLRLVVRGLPNKSIGRHLALAEGTVKVHVSAVLKALGASNRTQAVLAVNRLGVFSGD
ncbi:MAG: response regulator [Burkholderiales bacterium]|jgi:DNA-binding NarL/FixJ family response regulator